MRTIYIGLFFLLLLVSCSVEEKHSSLNLSVNPLEAKGEIPIENFLDTNYYELIRLENTRLPIGEITKMQVDDGKIFIMDKTTHSINVFGNKGNIILSLNKLGKSKNEYLQITDFYYSDGIIYVADILKLVILEYDLNGNCVKTIDFSKYWANKIFIIDKYLYLVNEYNDTESGKNILFKLDSKGNLVKSFIPFEKSYRQSSTLCYAKDKGNMIFGQRPDNKLYEITPDGCSELIALDFGKYNMPVECKEMDVRQLMENNVDNLYVHGIDKFQVSSKYIFIDVQDMNWDDFYIIYNRESKNVDYVCRGFDVSNFALKSFITNPVISEDFLYSPVSAEAFGELSNYLYKYESTNVSEQYLRDVLTINKSLKLDSNPIIIKYKLK